MRKFNKQHCDSKLRLTITDSIGRTISVTGKHAYEWSIIIELDNKITITTFSNREQAIKEFNNKYNHK